MIFVSVDRASNKIVRKPFRILFQEYVNLIGYNRIILHRT